MDGLKYRRVLLKMGGEALAGEGGFGINPRRAEEAAQKILTIADLGVEVALVIGGGNMWRGKEDGLDHGMERVTADHMGMLATVMNSLALQDALERGGLPTRVMTGIEIRAVAEPYIQRRAIRHMEKGPRRHLRGRHGQSLFYNRYGCQPAGDGNQRRNPDQSDKSGTRSTTKIRRKTATPAASNSSRISMRSICE